MCVLKLSYLQCTGPCTGILKGHCSALEKRGNTYIFVTAASPWTHILPISLETLKLSGSITNHCRHHAPATHIQPISLETLKLSGSITNRRHAPCIIFHPLSSPL